MFVNNFFDLQPSLYIPGLLTFFNVSKSALTLADFIQLSRFLFNRRTLSEGCNSSQTYRHHSSVYYDTVCFVSLISLFDFRELQEEPKSFWEHNDTNHTIYTVLFDPLNVYFLTVRMNIWSITGLLQCGIHRTVEAIWIYYILTPVRCCANQSENWIHSVISMIHFFPLKLLSSAIKSRARGNYIETFL